MVVVVEAIEVVEIFVAETIVSLKIVPSIAMAIGILVEVVVAIGTREINYTKGDIDMTFSDLDKRNTTFVDFSSMD